MNPYTVTVHDIINNYSTEATMTTFLVTGGAGFIGSNLCETLLADGHRVRVLDDLSSGKEENLKEAGGQIDFIKGDIRDMATVLKAVKGVDYVVHLAALGSVPRSVEDPASTHEVNATGTLNVLRASKEAGVKRVVYASSSSVYGDTPVLPKREDMLPTPQSPYAVSKLTGEHYCRVFNMVYGLETVAMRYFNVYGKRQDPASQYAAVIPKFITSLIVGIAPTIFGDGGQTRDFTFVEDCNQANYKACLAKGCAGEVFNVGYGERIDLNGLYAMIKKSALSSIEPVYALPRVGDIRDSLADISKAKKMIPYAPAYDINAGIAKTVQWYMKKYAR